MNRLVTPSILFGLLVAVAAVGCNRDAPTQSSNSARASTTAAPAAPAPSPTGQASPEHVVVYYFHATRRCRTCLGIQAAIQKTIQERFTVETMAGTLRFHEINIDEPQNRSFVKEFNLSFSSMVVALKNGDKTIKWQNCDKIWPLAHEPEALAKYVDEQIRGYLALLKKS